MRMHVCSLSQWPIGCCSRSTAQATEHSLTVRRCKHARCIKRVERVERAAAITGAAVRHPHAVRRFRVGPHNSEIASPTGTHVLAFASYEVATSQLGDRISHRHACARFREL